MHVRNLDLNDGSGSGSDVGLGSVLGRGGGLGERRGEWIDQTFGKSHGLDVARGKQKLRKFSARHPSVCVAADGHRPGYRRYFPDDIGIAGPSTSILPPRTTQTTRRVVSDPVYGRKERRKFLDPIEEVADEFGDGERPTPEPRVRFRSKSTTAIVPSVLQAPSRSPIAGDGDSQGQIEDSSMEGSVGGFEADAVEESLVQVEGGKAKGKDADGGMDKEELFGNFEDAFHVPAPSLILRRADRTDPIRRIKSILDTFVPESHSTPASKPNPAPRRASSSPPCPLPPSGPDYRERSDDPLLRTTGIGVPRPKSFNTSFLSPQTHKISRGQLVVLPSRALLVDFREGERRQGRQGVEVLTISPDGEEVCVVWLNLP